MYYRTSHNNTMLEPQPNIGPNKITFPYLLEKAPVRSLNFWTFSWDVYSRAAGIELNTFKKTIRVVTNRQ